MTNRPTIPITEQGAAAFLEAYGWLASSRHQRDRTAYRLLEMAMDKLSECRAEILLLKGEPAEGKSGKYQKLVKK